MQQTPWQEPDFLRLQVQQDQDSYLSKLTSFLAANPPQLPVTGPGSFGSLSSPESAGSSPSSNSDSPNTTTSVGQRPAAQVISSATTDKRKTSNDSTTEGALKDRRASSSTSLTDGIHTHPDNEDDDDDGEDGKKGGKTSERRRAQNRQAQRAFRERKEKHLKELEDRVYSLEQQSSEQVNENSALKELLTRLQSENERLKVYETAFSFSYAKDVSNSSSMPTSAQFGGKPPTPPTAQDEIDDLANFTVPTFDTNSPPSGSTSNNLFGASLFSPSTSAAFAAAGVSTSAASTSSSASPLGAFDDSFFSFSKSLSAPSPSSTIDSSVSSSSNNVRTPPDLTSDLFSTYRDPSASASNSFGGSNSNLFGGDNSFTDLDSFFGTSTMMDSTDFSNFLVSPSPPSFSASGKSPEATFGTGAASLPTPTSTQSKSASPVPTLNSACPLGTQPDKYTFDVDGLCSEMKAKATCKEAARQALQEAMKEDSNSLKTIFPGSI